MSSVYVDNLCIKSMSFVPDMNDLSYLYSAAKEADRALIDQSKTSILSKYKLIPDQFDPNQTVLVKYGMNSSIKSLDNSFSIINDRNMPFFGESNGPNGVLLDCHGKYGKNRINLFYNPYFSNNYQECGVCEKIYHSIIGGTYDTITLLEDYINFRDENIVGIFEMFVEHMSMSSFTDDFLINPSKYDKLSKDDQIHYINMCNMFNTILNNVLKGSTLEECGIGCESFCQSWIRNNINYSEDFTAQFSIMSPHFQTRFKIIDEMKIRDCGVSEGQLDSYNYIITKFMDLMDEKYGEKNGQAFINIDKMLIYLNSKKYIIYGYNIYVGFTNFISCTFEYFSDNTFQRSKNE